MVTVRKSPHTGAGGAYGDAGLDQQQKKQLKEHLLSSGMDDDEKTLFLDKVSIVIDESNVLQMFFGNKAESVKRIKKFSIAAHAMNSAIDGLKAIDEKNNQDPFQYLSIYFNDSKYYTRSKIKLYAKWRPDHERLEQLLFELQNTLKGLESVADYSLSQITVSTGDRPSDIKAKQLAYEITKIYKDNFDTLPPYTRGSWFAIFMDGLGEILNMSLGIKPLTYANNRLKT